MSINTGLRGGGKFNQKLYFKDNLRPNKKGCSMFAQTIANAIETALTPPPPTPPVITTADAAVTSAVVTSAITSAVTSAAHVC